MGLIASRPTLAEHAEPKPEPEQSQSHAKEDLRQDLTPESGQRTSQTYTGIVSKAPSSLPMGNVLFMVSPVVVHGSASWERQRSGLYGPV